MDYHGKSDSRHQVPKSATLVRETWERRKKASIAGLQRTFSRELVFLYPPLKRPLSRDVGRRGSPRCFIRCGVAKVLHGLSPGSLLGGFLLTRLGSACG